jgi:hypothetical protein
VTRCGLTDPPFAGRPAPRARGDGAGRVPRPGGVPLPVHWDHRALPWLAPPHRPDPGVWGSPASRGDTSTVTIDGTSQLEICTGDSMPLASPFSVRSSTSASALPPAPVRPAYRESARHRSRSPRRNHDGTNHPGGLPCRHLGAGPRGALPWMSRGRLTPSGRHSVSLAAAERRVPPLQRRSGVAGLPRGNLRSRGRRGLSIGDRAGRTSPGAADNSLKSGEWSGACGLPLEGPVTAIPFFRDLRGVTDLSIARPWDTEGLGNLLYNVLPTSESSGLHSVGVCNRGATTTPEGIRGWIRTENSRRCPSSAP